MRRSPNESRKTKGFDFMQKPMGQVPLITMEEHHEAFIVWQTASQRGLIPPAGNTLVHVDHHADLVAGRLTTSIHDLPRQPEAMAAYAYENLGIASFLVPVVYQGMVNHLVWINRHDQQQQPASPHYVASWQSEGHYFQTAKVTPHLRVQLMQGAEPWGNHQFYQYEELGTGSRWTTCQQVLLDIDLDFFSCDNALTAANTRMEITEAAYHEFRDQPLHPMRLLPAAALSVHGEETPQGPRYYLQYQEYQEVPNLARVSSQRIRKRVQALAGFLRRNHISPTLITLCRSRLSGYTPEDQWAFIEAQVCEALAQCYQVEIMTLEAFVAADEPLLPQSRRPQETPDVRELHHSHEIPDVRELQQWVKMACRRAVTDEAFRQLCLTDSQTALEKMAGQRVVLPVPLSFRSDEAVSENTLDSENTSASENISDKIPETQPSQAGPSHDSYDSAKVSFLQPPEDLISDHPLELPSPQDSPAPTERLSAQHSTDKQPAPHRLPAELSHTAEWVVTLPPFLRETWLTRGKIPTSLPVMWRAEAQALRGYQLATGEVVSLGEKERHLLSRWVATGARTPLIQTLKAKEFVQHPPTEAEKEILQEVLAQARHRQTPLRSLSAPEVLNLELTTRCPLRCPQCYCDLHQGKDLDLQKALTALEEAAELKIPYINLSGGETLVYPHLEALITFIREKGMVPAIAISGWGLTRERWASLKQAGNPQVYISLNGSTEAVNQLSRDGYHQSVKALALLQELGETDTWINWVARGDNVADFPQMLALARKYGVKGVVVLETKPDARGQITAPMNRQQLNQLAAHLKNAAKKGEQPYIELEPCFSPLKALMGKSFFGNRNSGVNRGCGAGRSGAALDVDGNWLPCRHLITPESWPTLQDYWHHSPRLKALRNHEENRDQNCQSCQMMHHCLPCRVAGSAYECPLTGEEEMEDTQ